jgi:hypothetical protein
MSQVFVLCIEAGLLAQQALLLCKSLRRFGGKHANDSIVAVCPRPSHAIDSDTRRQLRALDVDYIEGAINTECTEYGSANRIYAGAYVAERSNEDIIVVLDSDTIFLQEPDFTLEGIDVAIRPVDLKGACTTGPLDSQDPYWRSLCSLCGMDYDLLPWVTATVCGTRIKASYNGGLYAVRRNTGILQTAAEYFTRSVRHGLRPLKGQGGNVYASMGHVGTVASEYWGSNQAALSLAIWAGSNRVRLLNEKYNFPLHLFHEMQNPCDLSSLIHVHYHYMFLTGHLQNNPLFNPEASLATDRLAWLLARIPLDVSSP